MSVSNYCIVDSSQRLDLKDNKSCCYSYQPVAELAGEFPVSMIDTARVLEMLVPVVLVGEHLAASVTLVALGICNIIIIISSSH